MFKRFALVFVGGLLYMALWALPLYLWIRRFEGDDELILRGVGVMIVLILLGWIFYLNTASRIFFRLKGRGEPVSQTELRVALTSINELACPVRVERQGRLLIAGWRTDDLLWADQVRKRRAYYELRIKLRPRRRDALLIDVTTSTRRQWGLGWITGGRSFMRGVTVLYEGDPGSGEDVAALFTARGYRLSPHEIKHPIVDLVLARGWDVRFAIW